MKKTYIHPRTDVVKIRHHKALLAASKPPLSSEDYEEGDMIL
jgi:hypothetical protein